MLSGSSNSKAGKGGVVAVGWETAKDGLLNRVGRNRIEMVDSEHTCLEGPWEFHRGEANIGQIVGQTDDKSVYGSQSWQRKLLRWCGLMLVSMRNACWAERKRSLEQETLLSVQYCSRLLQQQQPYLANKDKIIARAQPKPNLAIVLSVSPYRPVQSSLTNTQRI